MDTRRTTLIATIAVIALLAVGIGYAYTAFTQNGGNSSNVGYITLTQVGDQTPYTFADGTTVKLDTYNQTNAQTVYYRLTDGPVIDTDVDYRVGVLGTITFHAALTGTDANPPSKLILSIPYSVNFDANANWQYFITSEPVDDTISTIYAYKDTVAGTHEWTSVSELAITGNAGVYTDKTVYVCYGYAATKETEDFNVGVKFLPTGEAYQAKALNAASITFKAVSEAVVTFNANNGDTPATITEKVQMIKTDYVLPTVAPEGFNPPQGKTFLGWNTDPDAQTAITGAQTIQKDVTYYAIWVEQQ